MWAGDQKSIYLSMTWCGQIVEDQILNAVKNQIIKDFVFKYNAIFETNGKRGHILSLGNNSELIIISNFSQQNLVI